MKLEPINAKYSQPIKVIAIILTSIAILLEISNIITKGQIANNFTVIVTLERIMLISHAIEAIISVFYTENKIKYAIYVFFVGTVGLLELFPEKQVKS